MEKNAEQLIIMCEQQAEQAERELADYRSHVVGMQKTIAKYQARIKDTENRIRSLRHKAKVYKKWMDR